MFLEFEFTFSFSRLLKPDHQENEPRAGQERELNTSWPRPERIEERLGAGADQLDTSWNGFANGLGFVGIVGFGLGLRVLEAIMLITCYELKGQAISHSRRSYSACRSATEAGLNALFWAVEAIKNMCMNKVILEVSSPEVYEMLTNPRHSLSRCALTARVLHQLSSISHYHLTYVHIEANQVAAEIALSVTRDTRLQSYVAHGGPTWLRTLILKEASVSATDDAS
ncbi:hypothetical protein DY000_02062700 [Brassica cretica]|uniref:RNase H type-1 domain-containing protein n=1 Tax=Brassica cretica TaxID=69181 RepID=A0ABQ7AUW9_BRACR|nr:hypothetical protein DY000_02062700 [Brassica cretica]